MSYTDELKELYSSNRSDLEGFDTLEISHSLFSKTYYFVKDGVNHTWELEDTTEKEFISFAFEIILPEAGSPQQDVAFSFDNTSLEIMREVEAASANITEAIKLIYRVYIDGIAEPQSTAIELSLTNIVADMKTISGVATRPDLFKGYFPAGNKAYFDTRFKGLYI